MILAVTNDPLPDVTRQRVRTAALRLLDHVLTACLLGDDFVPFGTSFSPDDVLTFDRFCRDQRDTWPSRYPGWEPLSEEECRHAWGDAQMLMISN